MSPKARRRQVILDVLDLEQPIASQDRLRTLLSQRGIASTQATLSRDLRDLNIHKSPAGYVRSTGADPATVASPQAEAAVRGFMLTCHSAASIVVLKTRPGHAPALATELDRAALPGSAGSIAGDDTIFLAAVSPTRARALARSFRALVTRA
ncbi:MAG: arginine repressor [Phycisphaerales bacterium]